MEFAYQEPLGNNGPVIITFWHSSLYSLYSLYTNHADTALIDG
jgi:lysophospholipid acyltransferase (LPLAT)-like uncharacterized protein